MSQKPFNFFELVGKTIVATSGIKAGDEDYTFTLSDGSVVRFYHDQDCCESVSVRAVNGDPDQLLYKKIIFAEEDNPLEHPLVGDMSNADSHTITTFTIKTEGGWQMEIVWVGESNGYYSESVSISIHEHTP